MTGCSHIRPERAAASRALRVWRSNTQGWRHYLDRQHSAVARAFGASGTRVTNAADFRRALAASFESRGPSVIDVVIDRDAIPPATRYDTVRTREL